MSTDKADILVSIIIPAYNAALFLRFTLESVISQSYDNLEILVIDDGSTDNTVEIASSYAIKDDRITILKQENKGVAAARNRGIECSKGLFIAFVDADDIWHPTAVVKMLNCFKRSSEELAVVYALVTGYRLQQCSDRRCACIEGQGLRIRLAHLPQLHWQREFHDDQGGPPQEPLWI